MAALVLYRQYHDRIVPFRAYTKKKVWAIRGVEIHRTMILAPRTSERGSRLTTLEARIRNGGFELNTFPATPEGFEAALKALSEGRAVQQAHLVRLDQQIDDPIELEEWFFQQLTLKATKRIK